MDEEYDRLLPEYDAYRNRAVGSSPAEDISADEETSVV
jgi:hypothetical protein